MSFFGKLVIALMLALLCGPLYAAQGGWQQDEIAAARLITAQDGAKPDGTLEAAIEIQLADGWHTYWRAAGDAGLPPSLDWSGSDNFTGAQLFYPLPRLFDENGLKTLGYSGRVLLPLRLQLAQAGKPASLNLKLDFLVCRELCIPKSFPLRLDLPAQGKGDKEAARLIAQAFEKTPLANPSPLLSLQDISIAHAQLSLTARADAKMLAPDLILETEDGTALLPSSKVLELDGRTATFQVPLTSEQAEKAASADGLALRATLFDGTRGIEVPIKAATTTPAALKLLGFALLALLGGLVLNLMPCVLPVLSLKVLGLVRHGGKGADEKRLVRRSFLSTAAGVVFSFLLLALATALLKEGGLTLGWGAQFQQPVFLVFLICVLTLFACNLLGFFEITLPRFFMDAIDPVHHPRLAGDFATGALATLLATPCTAPFLGTSVAFALTAGIGEIFIIFLALGLGMSAPYLLIALFPALAAKLPKPGKWMLALTRILGLGLAGTALWLLYVLEAEIGRNACLIVAALMLACGAVLAYRHKKGSHFWVAPFVTLLFLAALILSFAATTPEKARRNEIGWLAYAPEALDGHLRQGQTVYLEVTADWCLTCKLNKRMTLSREDVSALLLRTSGVVAMRADWTNPDPRVTALLRKHGRYGVPFAVVYGPKAAQGIVLPELLFANDVFEAVDKARGMSKTCPTDLPEGTRC